MQGGHTKQGELFIALTHEDHKPIIFDRALKAGNSVLLAAKMMITNPEEVNAAIVNGKHSKNILSQSDSVGSPQVPFLMCTLEIPKKLQHKFFALSFCYIYF